MRHVLLLLLFPVLAFAQQSPVHTHWGVFFQTSLNEEARTAVLRSCGAADGAEHFKVRTVSFVPKEGVEREQLLAHDAVRHVAPVYSTSDGKFVTYHPSFFVKLRPGQTIADVRGAAERIGVLVVGADRYLPHIIKLETPKHGIDAMEAIAQLRQEGQFAFVAPNLMHTVTDCNVDDPLFNRQWNLQNDGTAPQGNGTPGADMDVVAAWEETIGNPDIAIAILDSGVDTLHPDLEGKLLPGFDAMADPDSAGTLGYPTPTYSQDGHGTACAGIAAARGNNGIGIAGVCRGCSVIPVRVFAYQDILGEIQPFSDTESFMRGISWQWQVGGADVSSNSWGVPDFLLAFFPGGDLMVNETIDAATADGREGKGLPMLFSSGNDGVTDSIPLWPARYEKTIAVNATSMCDEQKTPSSCDGANWAGNYGNHLDCSAPGVRIPTTDMTGANGYSNGLYYNSFSGTSAACPNAAGVMGLLLSKFPDLTIAEAEQQLMMGCEKVGGYAYDQFKEHGEWSNELGYGRINARFALDNGLVGFRETNDLHTAVRTLSDHYEVVLQSMERVQWNLIDMNGRTVATGTAYGTLTVPHQGLASGIYALQMMQGQQVGALKMLVPTSK